MKGFFYITVFLFACKHFAFSQVESRDVLKPFTLEAIQNAIPPTGSWKPFPQSAAAWQAQYPSALLQKVVTEGEAVLNEPYPSISATVWFDFVRTGDHKIRYEKFFFRKREILWTAVMAEAVEGKGRFLDKISDGIWSICEETYWGTSSTLYLQKAGKGLPDVQDPVVDLYVPETAVLLGWADYFHSSALDSLSPQIRKRIRYEVERRLFKPLPVAKYFYLTSAKPNNWAPWIMSNYINAQLLFETDKSKRDSAIYFGITLINKYLNGLGANGSSDEGVGYWGQAAGCVFDALEMLHDASGGKLNVYDNPFIRQMGAYIYNMHIAGKSYINIGDAESFYTPNALLLFRYGKATSDATMTSFGSWVYHQYYDTANAPYLNNSRNGKARALYNMLAITACTNYAYTTPQVANVWVPDIQIMSAKANNGLFVACYGGNNGQSHNHNDVGNVLIYAGEEPVVIDVGPGNYTSKTFTDERYTLWFNTSQYHNLPVINGYGQSDGKTFTAREVNYTQTNTAAALSLDIAGCYKTEAGVKKWQRTVSMNKKTGVAQIQDKYEMNESPKSISQVFMTVCATNISTPGKIIFELASGKKVEMDYDKNYWEVQKEKMELKGKEDRKFIESWEGKDIWRIQVVAKPGLSKKGTISYLFSLVKY